MDQKKKPPAGATLISRLREGRIKREQSLAVRQEVIEKEMERHEVDFIRKEITIDELRPISDDYDLLTEEIRLAGRFAAVGLIAQGLRLARLKDDQIYKKNYPTFEEYCRQEHTMSATYAYRLIRMSEMAERLAEEGGRGAGRVVSGKGITDAMPNPFEAMLGLGHRHLIALLPLESEAAEELLLKGVPVADKNGQAVDRIPIGRATEKQLRQALSLIAPKPILPKVVKQPHAVPSRRTVVSLKDMVEVLQEWAEWLESEPEDSILIAKTGDRKERSRLAQRMRVWVDRVIKAL